jgi:hypothetical protein
MVSWLLRFAAGACFIVAAFTVGKVFDFGVWQAWALGGVAALIWSGLGPLPRMSSKRAS